MTSWSNSHTLYWQHLATRRCLVLKLSTFDSRLVVAMKYNQIWYDMIDKAFILNHWLSAINILAPSDPMFLIFVRNQRCRVCCVAIWRRRLCMHFWGHQAFSLFRKKGWTVGWTGQTAFPRHTNEGQKISSFQCRILIFETEKCTVLSLSGLYSLKGRSPRPSPFPDLWQDSNSWETLSNRWQ